jgi:ribosomal protein S18
MLKVRFGIFIALFALFLTGFTSAQDTTDIPTRDREFETNTDDTFRQGQQDPTTQAQVEDLRNRLNLTEDQVTRVNDVMTRYQTESGTLQDTPETMDYTRTEMQRRYSTEIENILSEDQRTQWRTYGPTWWNSVNNPNGTDSPNLNDDTDINQGTDVDRNRTEDNRIDTTPNVDTEVDRNRTEDNQIDTDANVNTDADIRRNTDDTFRQDQFQQDPTNTDTQTQVEDLRNRLNLTEDQVSRVNDVMTRYQTESGTIQDTPETMDYTRTEMQRRYSTEIENILTEDQRTQWRTYGQTWWNSVNNPNETDSPNLNDDDTDMNQDTDVDTNTDDTDLR